MCDHGRLIRLAGLRALFALPALLAAAAAASGAVAQTVAWSEDTYNPVVADDDLRLPMPCGGSMVFRPVAVIGGRPFDDQRISLGGADAPIGYLGGTREDYVAGPFPDPGNPSRRRYYIGKYEITVGQLAAMNADCKATDAASILPATNVSWFEAFQAASQYSRWLIAHARDLLPHADGAPAFVRLPTEAEWEFAARGGTAVDASAFAANRFPMPSDDGFDEGSVSDYAWHQGTDSANGRLQPIGGLKPNPLGVFDILGNAGEMIFEPFRLSRRGRFHGQAGGMIVRGADYTTPRERQETTWRYEFPIINTDKGQEYRNERIGFRFVLGAPTVAVTSPMERVKDLESAWRALPVANEGDVADAREKSAMEDIAKAVLKAESMELRSQLNDALASLENGRTERNDARDRLVRVIIRSGAIFAERVSIEIARQEQQKIAAIQAEEVYRDSLVAFRTIETQGTPEDAAVARQDLDTVKQEYDQRAEAVKNAAASADTALIRYSDMVVELANEYGGDLLRRQSDLLKAELEVRRRKDLAPAVDLFVRHAIEFQQSGPRNPKDWRQEISNTFAQKR